MSTAWLTPDGVYLPFILHPSLFIERWLVEMRPWIPTYRPFSPHFLPVIGGWWNGRWFWGRRPVRCRSTASWSRPAWCRPTRGRSTWSRPTWCRPSRRRPAWCRLSRRRPAESRLVQRRIIGSVLATGDWFTWI